MSTETMLRLYKAFILPHFYYCSMVWHFSSKQDSDKLDLLNNVFFDLFSRVLTLSTIIYLKRQECPPECNFQSETKIEPDFKLVASRLLRGDFVSGEMTVNLFF